MIRSDRPFRRGRVAFRMMLAVVGGAGSALEAGSPPIDLLSLPRGELRAADALGLSWTSVDGSQQPQGAIGESILVLPDAIVSTGRATMPASTPTVAIWERVPGDAIAPWLGWRLAGTLTSFLPASAGVGPAAGFGAALAGDERWLFVGAPETAVRGANLAGAVFAFRRDEGDGWKPYAVLANPLPFNGGGFGSALAFRDGVLLVGVPTRYAIGTDDPVGGADRFVVDDDSIGSPLSLTSPIGGNWNAKLGRSVAIEGDRFALGDGDAIIPGIPTRGVVAVFTVATPDDPEPILDAVLASPTSQVVTRFGASIDLDGGRLAVAAPLEDRAEKTDCGVVRLYERTVDGWQATHEFVGPESFSAYARVDLDGEFLAVGGDGPSDPDDESGRAVLAEIVGSAIVIRAETGGGLITPGVQRDDVGRAVALAHGTWAYAETQRYPTLVPSAETSAGSVRFHRVAAALSDCDGDGASDLSETLSGAEDRDGNGIPDECAGQPDCDGNGLADSLEVLWSTDIAPVPSAMGGWFELISVSEANPNAYAVAHLVPKVVPAAGSGILHGVALDAIALRGRAQPIVVAVYDDPNQDGDPTDALLRLALLVEPTTAAGPERIILPPQAMGPPGTRYFIALVTVRLPNAKGAMSLRGALPAAAPSDTWRFAGRGAFLDELDLAHPTANEFFAPDAEIGKFDCEGLFASGADADLDGAPDACACPADLDRDGMVGTGDLAILLGAWGGPDADLDGDGTTGASDLASLLAAWGGC